jgi:protein-disulfide isomerase
VTDDVDSAGSSGVAGTPTSFAKGRRQYGAYDIDTLTAAVKTAKAQPKLDVPYRPGQVDDK